MTDHSPTDRWPTKWLLLSTGRIEIYNKLSWQWLTPVCNHPQPHSCWPLVTVVKKMYKNQHFLISLNKNMQYLMQLFFGGSIRIYMQNLGYLAQKNGRVIAVGTKEDIKLEGRGWISPINFIVQLSLAWLELAKNNRWIWKTCYWINITLIAVLWRLLLLPW